MQRDIAIFFEFVQYFFKLDSHYFSKFIDYCNILNTNDLILRLSKFLFISNAEISETIIKKRIIRFKVHQLFSNPLHK